MCAYFLYCCYLYFLYFYPDSNIIIECDWSQLYQLTVMLHFVTIVTMTKQEKVAYLQKNVLMKVLNGETESVLNGETQAGVF